MIASNIPASLTPTESTDNSPRKSNKKMKQVKRPPPLRTSQGTWARSNVEKAHAITEHLPKAFQQHPKEEAYNSWRPPTN
jgi:hypothetical protein